MDSAVSKKKEGKSTSSVLKPFASLASIPFHPLNYTKILIQLGHEPLPPFKSTSIFGREQLYYPNVFSYVRYVHSVEGIAGLYRGLGMRIISNVVGNQAQGLFEKLFVEEEKKDETSVEEIGFERFARETLKSITTKSFAIVLSHPFHVMTIRCMSQFVGGETDYSSWNIFQNTLVIYRHDGLSGFFSGLVPRLLFEASTIAITSLLSFVIKTYIFEEKQVEVFVDMFASLMASSITYPLSVVSTCATVAGSGLLAGSPPKMRRYETWVEIFKHLNESNQFKRGSSLFFRTCSGMPQIMYGALA